MYTPFNLNTSGTPRFHGPAVVVTLLANLSLTKRFRNVALVVGDIAARFALYDTDTVFPLSKFAGGLMYMLNADPVTFATRSLLVLS